MKADFFLPELGRPLLTENPVVKEVAKKLGATEAQVLIAWGVYRGYSVIPKSVKEGQSFQSKMIFFAHIGYDRAYQVQLPAD